MELGLSFREAAWFLPFVAPICLYVAFTDLSRMKITNVAVVALMVVFLLVGLIALPVTDWLWRWSHFAVILCLGFVLNAAGALGAGDAKFAAAAAPFVALSDVAFLMVLLAGMLLGAYATHRIAKFSPLRRLAPDWESWNRGRDFPMGLALGPTLAIYLALGLFGGATP